MRYCIKQNEIFSTNTRCDQKITVIWNIFKKYLFYLYYVASINVFFELRRQIFCFLWLQFALSLDLLRLLFGTKSRDYCNYLVLFKVTPLRWNLMLKFFQSSQHFRNALFGHSSFRFVFYFISSIVAKRFPFIGVFSFGKMKN